MSMRPNGQMLRFAQHDSVKPVRLSQKLGFYKVAFSGADTHIFRPENAGHNGQNPRSAKVQSETNTSKQTIPVIVC